jgi:ornithine decarboxylase
LRTQVAKWKQELPNVKPYYAVKCNPETSLIQALSSMGVGFDCASSKEIDIVKKQVDNPDIIFANPCKKRDDILFAMDAGIDLTVVDSKEEVQKLSECGWRGSSLIRIMVNDVGSRMPFSSKFGAHLTQSLYIYKIAKILGQNVSGISFHVGSGCQDVNQFYDAIMNANSIISQLAHHANKQDYIINIGGGFENHSFFKAAHSIRRSRGFIPFNTRVIAEPGRYFAANYQDLFVKVIGKKNSAKGFRYTIDESLYGQFSCIPFDQARPTWIRVRKQGEAPRRRVHGILYGRTCDSLDMIAMGDSEELEEGDWLWFPNMGAYTSVTSTEFNGFPKPHFTLIDENLPELNEFHHFPENVKYVSNVTVP